MGYSEKRRWLERHRWSLQHPEMEQEHGCATPMIAACLIVAILLIGCKTHEVIVEKPVEVPHYIHDTLRVTQTEKETVYVTDSIWINGDTVFRYRDRWREYAVHDTVLHIVRDTIGIPVEVTKTEIKEVEKDLYWWQKGLMWFGGAFLIFAVVWLTIKLKR